MNKNKKTNNNSSDMFWLNNPSILLNKNYVFEIYPTQKMCYEERLNAITRLIIILTIIGALITMSIPIIFIGVITISCIIVVYKLRKNNKTITENYENSVKPLLSPVKLSGESSKIINPETLETFLKKDFEPTNSKNPLQNVLLNEITYNSTRKSAPPSFTTQVYEDINNSTKQLIQELNPTIKDTNKQLFGDLKDNFDFDQSMWSFYSTPNTRVANDQSAFADYLYGDMPSAKEGDPNQLLKDNFRYTLY
jgi:hypothetical protein